MPTDAIIVRGARVHNLKNIDFEIVHNAVTVVTGVSGSGKSSLAFDTIYAEGQRRYVESLSAYARQFLERIEKPDVDVIEGVAPAVAIRQKNTTRNPRSTVATATEIYDYLRLLFARVGRTYCVQCGAEVRRDSVDEVAERMLALDEGTRLNALFPVAPMEANGGPALGAGAGQAEAARKGAKPKRGRPRKKQQAEPAADLFVSERLRERLFELRKRGFNRLFQGGRIYEFSTPESLLDLDFAQPLYALADRLVISPEVRSRLVDAVETGYREAGEIVFQTAPRASEVGSPEMESGEISGESQNPHLSAQQQEAKVGHQATVGHEGHQEFRFAQRFECKTCRLRYEEPEPRMFSFNNPYGACPECQGFGNTIDFDLGLVVPDKGKTLAEGAIEPWTKPKYRTLYTELKRFAKERGIPLDVPWEELEDGERRVIIDGEKRFPGVRGFFAYLERKKYKLHVRVFLSRYRGYSTCSACGGARLRREARQVKITGRDICEVTGMTVEQGASFFAHLELTREEAEIAGKVLEEIRERLRFLVEVGLEYLTLDRLASSLSGGEAQRIQLASSLGSRLVGTLYVLDEPSIGLHPRDTHRLIKILKDLRDLGNTILVVEHDPDIMRASDRILDLGPGAGENGGRLVAAGSYEDLKRNPQSLTGRYLSGELRIPIAAHRRKPGAQRLRIKGARAHNLKRIDVEIPLGMLVAITGVSGSGKSTLVHDVLYRALTAHPQDGKGENQFTPAGGKSTRAGDAGPLTPVLDGLRGAEFLDETVLVDQSAIGRTPRSNPVTYIKAFDAIRELFAALPEARKNGFGPGYFSFNIPGGRCETCRGDGTVTVEMQFLADVELICEECKGARYRPEVLAIAYRGKNIHEVLQMTVREALRFFASAPKVADKLRVLEEVGLGYLRLGQSATTLSGGEAQRMKLAAHLQGKSVARESGAARKRQRVLYIFDEPTTGLHFDDVSKLLAAFGRLIEAGGSIVVIEHNLDVIRAADWVIDLGPEGGERGGRVLAAGTPEALAESAGTYTGAYLARILPNLGNTGARPGATPAEEAMPVAERT